ncbi:hypothetical protein TNCV_2105531 [Trichonephila clavipes]|nr:hypothetical protein TNCV_2105531 [Trichonephila clavipes]
MYVVSYSFEHLAGDRTIQLGFTPILKENTLGVVRGLTLSSLSTNLTRGLAARWLFRVPPYRKCTMHLQISMFSQGFEPSNYGNVVSVANHYTGWATLLSLNYLNGLYYQ